MAESVLVDRKALADGGKFIVLPFADAPGEQADGSGQVVTGVIAAQMLLEPNVKLFDVGPLKLTQALEKTGFDAADVNDPAVAAQIGRALGAQFVVTGELIHYDLEKQASSSSVWVFQSGDTKTRHWVCIHLRIVRASDGKIVYAGHGSASSGEGYAGAAENACEEALKNLDDILRG
jgi:curli biogenesis system outer membrane secretion channel CsgG